MSDSLDTFGFGLFTDSQFEDGTLTNTKLFRQRNQKALAFIAQSNACRMPLSHSAIVPRMALVVKWVEP